MVQRQALWGPLDLSLNLTFTTRHANCSSETQHFLLCENYSSHHPGLRCLQTPHFWPVLRIEPTWMSDFSFMYLSGIAHLNYKFLPPPAESLPQVRIFCLPAGNVSGC